MKKLMAEEIVRLGFPMKTIARLQLALIVSWWLMLSCGPMWYWTITPGSYLIGWQDEEVPVDVPIAFDAAAERAMAYWLVRGQEEVYLRERLLGVTYYLHTEPYPTNDSPTGWAAGTTYWPYQVIELAQKVGSNPLDFPAFEHEVGHLLFGEREGH